MKIGIFIAVLSLFLISAFCVVRPDRDAADDVNNLITSLFDRKEKGEDVNLHTAIREFVDLANEYRDPMLPVDNPLGFWQWLPIYHTSVLPGTTGTFSSSCFQSNNFTVKIDSHHETTYEITSGNPVSDNCMDYYLIATLEDARVLKVKSAGTITRKWIYRNLRGALEWDVQTNGFRIFRFLNDPEQTLASLGQTAALFEPILQGPAVAEEFAELNVQFLTHYANMTLDKRKTEVVTINESMIHSGDFFGITRLDGLDPMIIWGYGGATGHTAVALWIDGELFICESTVNSDYWPTNGIQKTPYATWIKQAQAASYNYVWVPLAANISSTFNATAAAEFFAGVEGTPYGFHNFLFGWLDTMNDNFPCLPPAYDNCLSSQVVQVLSGLVAAIDQPLAYRFFIQAFNKRLGTDFNDTATIYQYAQVNEGIPFDVLYTIPEEDAWVYNDGYSMVCDVFVCEIWKSAGLFGNLANVINCTEQTPFDVYSMAMFDTEWTPPQNCQEADPGLNYCQLGGKYRLLLNKFGTRDPYPLMDQTCPSLAPSYDRPSNC